MEASSCLCSNRKTSWKLIITWKQLKRRNRNLPNREDRRSEQGSLCELTLEPSRTRGYPGQERAAAVIDQHWPQWHRGHRQEHLDELGASKAFWGSCAETGVELTVDPSTLTLHLALLEFFHDEAEYFFLYSLRGQSSPTFLGVPEPAAEYY